MPLIKKDWFRVRRYPHIGLPLRYSDRRWVSNYVSNTKKVSAHPFVPFIHREVVKRKFRRAKKRDGTKEKNRTVSAKTREIFYANHLDSNIYGYYAELIQKKYEKKLLEDNISDCILAYRRILHESEKRNKCNVDFANDIFKEIKRRQADVLVLCFDISTFFDNLDHKNLKKSWKEVMGFEGSMPKDHYNIFKNITKFSYVDENSIFKKFKDRIYVERLKDGKRVYKQRKVKKKKYLRNSKAVAYCDKDGLLELRQAGLIKSNKVAEREGNTIQRDFGIPQGSPISSLLANLYLFKFDKKVSEFLSAKGGIYRRYSDDILIICRPGEYKEVKDFIISSIREPEVKLLIQDEKTQGTLFKWNEEKSRHNSYDFLTGKAEPLAYLGFEFDGYYTLLKSASLARFYRMMKRSIRRGKYYARIIKNETNGNLFKGRLYKKFTVKGAGRRMIWQRSTIDKTKYYRSNKYDWGNYLSYAKLAINTIENNKIKGQIRGHWKKFHEELGSEPKK